MKGFAGVESVHCGGKIPNGTIWLPRIKKGRKLIQPFKLY